MHDDDGSAPVVVNNLQGVAINTNFQPRKPFLCWDCEQRFSEKGEGHVISNCFRGSAGFPLRQALSQLTPIPVTGGQAVFDTEKLPAEVHPEAYRYFALSIFWRASATDWPKGYARSYRHRLGTKYEEAIRQYLLLAADLPTNIGLNVLVSFEPVVYAISYAPTYARINENALTVHRHTFMIPGVRFMMLIGDHVAKIRHQGERDTNSSLRFVAWIQTGSEFEKGLATDTKCAVPKGKLSRE